MSSAPPCAFSIPAFWSPWMMPDAGFASMRHILELQPDFAKLDIGLVRGIDEDRSARRSPPA